MAPSKMSPGCSTNRNHTAGLPLSFRFSQRPATVGSAARACGMEAANATNADKARVASFAVTLEILPIRPIDPIRPTHSPHNMAVSRKEGSHFAEWEIKEWACAADRIVPLGRRNAFLAAVLWGSNSLGLRPIGPKRRFRFEGWSNRGMPRPPGRSARGLHANVPIQHCPEQPARGCDRHRPGVPFRPCLSRVAAGERLPLRRRALPLAGHPHRRQPSLVRASTCSAPGRTSA